MRLCGGFGRDADQWARFREVMMMMFITISARDAKARKEDGEYGRDSERLVRIMKEVGCCNSILGFR